MVLLNKSQELVTIIKEFKAPGSKINSELIHGAQSSRMKIENLMEMLQDRRRQLEEQSHYQRCSLEQILQMYRWEQQADEVRAHLIFSPACCKFIHEPEDTC